MKVDAILVKPLDGAPIGTPRAFEKIDFDRLKAMGAVRERGETDDAPPPVDENAELIERLRHPVEGPVMLAEMKSKFDSMSTEIERLRGELVDSAKREEGQTTALIAAKKAHHDAVKARDAAIIDRDAANGRVIELQTAHDAAKTELSELKAGSAARGKASREA